MKAELVLKEIAPHVRALAKQVSRARSGKVSASLAVSYVAAQLPFLMQFTEELSAMPDPLESPAPVDNGTNGSPAPPPPAPGEAHRSKRRNREEAPLA